MLRNLKDHKKDEFMSLEKGGMFILADYRVQDPSIVEIGYSISE